jgi:uncharacterized protein (TIGR03083 family)
MDVWPTVAARRVDLARWARQLDPAHADAPSWCTGWRVREVLGHLVHLAEASQFGMARDVVKLGPSPDRALDRAARELGARPVRELAGRLERAAHGQFHVLGSPAPVALAEVIVHGCDMTRTLEVPDDVEPSVAVPLVKLYRRIGRFAFHAAPSARATLVATDAPVSLGAGPEVRGTALDLLLLLANRRQVVANLAAPGLSLLAQ